MKVYKLTISTAKPELSDAARLMVGSSRESRVSKEELFASEEAANDRMKQIQVAVGVIALVPWLVEVRIDELTVLSQPTPGPAK